MKAVIIGILVFFIGLLIVTWIVAEHVDPEMLPPPEEASRHD